jgi:hypothetical protein
MGECLGMISEYQPLVLDGEIQKRPETSGAVIFTNRQNVSGGGAAQEILDFLRFRTCDIQNLALFSVSGTGNMAHLD